MTLSSCHLDPARALVPVLTAMPAAGIPLGDILADSGYAHRDAGAWAIPLPAAGAQLVQDLHPSDRGPRGTHHGAIIANGNLYCPATPRPLLELAPAAPAPPPQNRPPRTTADRRDWHATSSAPSPPTTPTATTASPAPPPWARSAARCRPASMTLDRNRPEILTPPEHPPACCTQQTITVPPEVAAKTRQKHDYPSRAHRRSYARRTGAERTFSTVKDPATNNIARGWCRLMGLTPLTLWLACLLPVRNQRILNAYDARQADNARRAAAGLPAQDPPPAPKTLTSLAAPP